MPSEKPMPTRHMSTKHMSTKPETTPAPKPETTPAPKPALKAICGYISDYPEEGFGKYLKSWDECAQLCKKETPETKYVGIVGKLKDCICTSEKVIEPKDGKCDFNCPDGSECGSKDEEYASFYKYDEMVVA